MRRGFAQHLNFIFSKDSRLYRLHYENPLQNAAVDEGNAEEGLIRILTRFVKIFEARMIVRLLHGHGAHLLRHQASQAFVDGHAQLADALATQSDGCGCLLYTSV